MCGRPRRRRRFRIVLKNMYTSYFKKRILVDVVPHYELSESQRAQRCAWVDDKSLEYDCESVPPNRLLVCNYCRIAFTPCNIDCCCVPRVYFLLVCCYLSIADAMIAQCWEGVGDITYKYTHMLPLSVRLHV